MIYSDILVCLLECNARRPAAHALLSGSCGGHAVCDPLPSIKCLHALHTSLAVFAHLMSLCTFGCSGQVVACKHSLYTKPVHTATVKVCWTHAIHANRYLQGIDYIDLRSIFLFISYILLFRFEIYFCRYRRLYNAAIKDRAVTYAWFFIAYLIHIAFCVWSAIAPPLPGANAWSHTGFIACVRAFSASKFVGVVYTIGGVLWSLESLWSLWVLKTVRTLLLICGCFAWP